MKNVWSNLRGPSVDPGLITFAAVLTASLVLNIRLELNATAKLAVPGETGFLSGTRLPNVWVSAPGESERPLSFTRNTLLYIFSPGCEWSKANYPNVTAIVRASARNYDVLGLYTKPHNSDLEVATYLASHPFPGKTIAVDLDKAKLPDDIVRRFQSTPQLLVVAPGGLIRRAWSGALFGRRQADSEQYFGLKLPGARMVGGVAVLASDSAAAR